MRKRGAPAGWAVAGTASVVRAVRGLRDTASVTSPMTVRTKRNPSRRRRKQPLLNQNRHLRTRQRAIRVVAGRLHIARRDPKGHVQPRDFMGKQLAWDISDRL